MIQVEISHGGHQWAKENMVTQHNRNGMYDVYRCSCCGLEVKSYSLGMIAAYEKDRAKLDNCPGRASKSQIRITHCNANGKQFENLFPGSKHMIIPPPPGYDNKRGEWVMGMGEPVLVLFNEFVYIQ